MRKLVDTVLILFPFLLSAQLHLGVGAVDISDRMDGNSLTWHLGYRQDIGKFGIDFNYRNTIVFGENFNSWEFRSTYRISDSGYRLDLGGGMGFNPSDNEIYPVVHVRNAFRLSEGLHAILDFDNSFRKERSETYLSVGVSVDYDFIKDLFNARPRQ